MSAGPGGPAGETKDGGAARPEAGGGGKGTRFRTTLVRVLTVQVVTLVLLWLLQAAYHG